MSGRILEIQKEYQILHKQVADFAEEIKSMKEKMAAISDEPRDLQRSI